MLLAFIGRSGAEMRLLKTFGVKNSTISLKIQQNSHLSPLPR